MSKVSEIEDEKSYWILWNQLYAQIGPIRFEQALKAFGSAKEAWEAPIQDFYRLGWEEAALELLKERGNLAVEPILSSIVSMNSHLTAKFEENYPENLLQIADPPPLLYTRGELLPRDRLALAVVGSRRATNYGREVVRALVPDLAMAGLTIVSGLALGIDAEAHRAALSASGRTIGVLACGIDQVYPPSNAEIAREMIESDRGVLLTEFPPGTPTYPANFPVRNRVISGLALGTLVIEAAEGSGTFHTVSSALEQGREVFAVPGSIFSPYSAGCAKLIEQGAKPVTCAADILEELEVSAENFRQEVREAAPFSPEEKEMLARMGADELHIDELVRQSDLDTAKVSSLLTVMEMKGLVRHLGGGIYQATIRN